MPIECSTSISKIPFGACSGEGWAFASSAPDLDFHGANAIDFAAHDVAGSHGTDAFRGPGHDDVPGIKRVEGRRVFDQSATIENLIGRRRPLTFLSYLVQVG